MRRAHLSFVGALMLCLWSASAATAVSSPYPAALPMKRGLANSAFNKTLPWGTLLTAAQSRWVTLKAISGAWRWGVWKENGGPATIPVRSNDGGFRWMAAGPELATDWAGGSLYYVSKVAAESSSAVVMVSNSVIDVTTDSGHQWYQYLNPGDNWTIATQVVSASGIGLRVSPASYATLPKGSYADYVLDVTQHRWLRASQSLG